jgi:hypothetical protein
MSKARFNPYFQNRHNAKDRCFNTTIPAATVFDGITLDDIRADYARREALILTTQKGLGLIPNEAQAGVGNQKKES